MKIRQWIREQKRRANDPSTNVSPIWKPLIWILPAILILGMFSFYPIYESARASTLLPGSNSTSIGFDAYTTLFDPTTHEGSQMNDAVVNSILYSLISIPVGLTISIVVSFALSRVINKATRGFFQTLFFLPYVTSALAISFTFLILFDGDSSLINQILKGVGLKPLYWLSNRGTALAAMLVFGIWRSTPFMILILTMSFLSTSSKPDIAARIDGANAIKRFFRISLPAIKPTLVYLITISVIGSMKVFPIGLFPSATIAQRISDAHAWTLVYLSYHFFMKGDTDLATASSLIILVIVMAMSIATILIRKALTPPKEYKNKFLFIFNKKQYSYQKHKEGSKRE